MNFKETMTLLAIITAIFFIGLLWIKADLYNYAKEANVITND